MDLSALLVFALFQLSQSQPCTRACNQDFDCPVGRNIVCQNGCCVNRVIGLPNPNEPFGRLDNGGRPGLLPDRCRGLRTCSNDFECRRVDQSNCVDGCCVDRRCRVDQSVCADRCCDQDEECRNGRCCNRRDCGREDNREERCARLRLQACGQLGCGRGFTCELGCCVQRDLPDCPRDRECQTNCCDSSETCVGPVRVEGFCCPSRQKCGHLCCRRDQQCNFLRNSRELVCRDVRFRQPGFLQPANNEVQIVDE